LRTEESETMRRHKSSWFALLLVVLLAGTACRNEANKREPLLQVSLATTPVIYTGLIAIAHEKDFFRESGLEVAIRSDYPAGLASMQALERGEVDMATGAVFVFSGMMEDNPTMRILASVGSTSDHEIVARRDRGIRRPSDLSGKRIGVVMGTVSEYALSMFLEMNGMDLSSVSIVDLSAPDTPAALAGGEVDAISVWGRFSHQARQLLGGNGMAWPSQYDLDYRWVLAAREEFLERSPEIAKGVLLALNKAEEFTLANQEEAKAIITEQWKLDPVFVHAVWNLNKLQVRLDQQLIVGLESTLRWRMINKGKPQDMHNVLEKIHQDPLEQIDPSAVTISK
jgi:ABC-type nitrate/sulfonate/bicarbonate transport system substrate-binding protein